MELKRRLNAAAKRCIPTIEASNTGQELTRLTDRIEELLTYAEEKDARRIERDKTGKSASQRQAEAAEKREQERADKQDAIQKEMIDDQNQAKAQPNVAEDADAGGEPAQAE